METKDGGDTDSVVPDTTEGITNEDGFGFTATTRDVGSMPVNDDDNDDDSAEDDFVENGFVEDDFAFDDDGDEC